MPLFDYRCEACGRVEEVMQAFGDPPLTTCPACGGTLKKLPSAPAVQFKGSGWYVSDYGRGSGKKDADKGAGAGASEAGETKEKKETKETKETKAAEASAPAKAESGPPEKKPG